VGWSRDACAIYEVLERIISTGAGRAFELQLEHRGMEQEEDQRIMQGSFEGVVGSLE